MVKKIDNHDDEILVPSLAECVDKLSKISQRFVRRKGRTFTNYQQAEYASQEAFAAYLDEWLDNRKEALKFSEQIKKGISVCCEITYDIPVRGKAQDYQRTIYRMDMEQRLERMQVLEQEGYSEFIALLDRQIKRSKYRHIA